MSYLPSRKIIFLIAAVLIVFAAGFWFLSHKNAPAGDYAAQNIFSGNLKKIAEKLNNLDSNNDGLKDWEETLQSVQGDDRGDFVNNLNSSESANLTKKLAESMGVQIAAMQEGEYQDISGAIESMDENTNRDLLEFIASFNARISEEELKISQDNSFNAVKKYVEESGGAIPENPYPQKAEDDIFTEAINSEDFRAVDEYIQYYEQAIANMKNVVVPSDFLAMHKREIELFMATKKVYECIKEVGEDPLKTVIALQQNEKIREEMKNLIVDFLDLVREHDK